MLSVAPPKRPHVPHGVQHATFLIACREVRVTRCLDAQGDLVERPVKGSRLPFIRIGGPVKDGLDAMRVDGKEQRVGALGAKGSLVDRAARVALDIDQLAALGVNQLGAAHGAVGTEALGDGSTPQARALLGRLGAEGLGLGLRGLRSGHEGEFEFAHGCLASVVLERDVGNVVRVIEPDVECPQVSMQAGVLDWNKVSRRSRFVVVRMPEARRSDERRSRLPVSPLRVLDVALVIDLASDQGVAALLALDDEVQGDRLMPVRKLDGPGGQHAEHGPDHMRDRPGLVELLVGQQDADTAALLRFWFFLDFGQLGGGLLVWVEGRFEPGASAFTPR